MEHLSVDDLKKLLHGGKITLPEFVRFSGDVNRRNLAAEAADDDDEVSDMVVTSHGRHPQAAEQLVIWYGECQAPARCWRRLPPQAAQRRRLRGSCV